MYCFGLGIDPNALLDVREAFLQTFQLGPDVNPFERLTREEALEHHRSLERKGLVHTIWTFKTPFIGAICNCDRTDCLAMMAHRFDFRLFFGPSTWRAFLPRSASVAVRVSSNASSAPSVFRWFVTKPASTRYTATAVGFAERLANIVLSSLFLGVMMLWPGTSGDWAARLRSMVISSWEDVPATRVLAKGISREGVGQAPQAAPAKARIEAAQAAGADSAPIAQTHEERIGIQVPQRSLQEVAHCDGHPATGQQIAIGHNGHQRIAGRALIGTSSAGQELQGPVHGDPRPAGWRLRHGIPRLPH